MTVSIGIAFVLSILVAALLYWRLGSRGFRRIDWKVFALACALFWGIFAFIMHWLYWESYYRYFAPAFVQWLTPLAAIFYVLVGLGMRWLALRMPGNVLINFCLLGGLESVPEHLLAIFRMHILDIPMFAGISPWSIFFFAFFEYVIYWGITVGVAALLDLLFRSRDKPAA